jgi:very-short-patch-repair endonuclease
MHLPYNHHITANAKKLRKEMTAEEKKLWYQYLHSYPISFTKQKVIENCVLDFYCAKCRLGIELDGGQHQTEQGLGHDEARTKL